MPLAAVAMRHADRLVWLGLFLAAAALVLLARWLVPDARGFGTHTQLGLPPCGFRALTSLPCPSCGFTTAFAHIVRGELALAGQANAFGALLCVLTVASLPVSMWGVVRGLPPSTFVARARLHRGLLGLCALGFVHWLARLAVILVG